MDSSKLRNTFGIALPDWHIALGDCLLDEARWEIEQWRKHYNYMQPHSALGYLPPVEFAKQAAQSNRYLIQSVVLRLGKGQKQGSTSRFQATPKRERDSCHAGCK